MIFGAFGNVVFQVDAKTVRTFTDFTRNNAGRWAKHDILLRKPKSQFLGPGLDKVSFSMRFDASFGVKPRKELDNLVMMERSGKAYVLTLGGKALGTGLWVITGLDQAYVDIDNKGNVLVGTAGISLEEYVVKKK